MDKAKLIKKVHELSGFGSLTPEEKEDVESSAILTAENEFKRLTNEMFHYTPDAPCLDARIFRIEDDGIHELIYFADLVKPDFSGTLSKPICYMIGYSDMMFVAAATSDVFKTPAEMFDIFLKSYQKQSDDEFIGIPVVEFMAVIKAGEVSDRIDRSCCRVVIGMPDYPRMVGNSSEIQKQIKDSQGAEMMVSGIDTACLQRANTFADNVINRSAWLISKSYAEMGMMGEQAVSHGYNAASAKVTQIQISGSALAGMAGMF
ncbi:hypothetical protein L9H26_19175 [Morganella psychrotolerans]|uniref:Uncharacterized protein n=1 Tax=Morganella psychrotolerans TaxID=368603 RepID=A0A5M9QYX7_9GAMM|nr:hypothetical protein [Morganella psychrotolerans]KAA8713022.1 hypothetical protein F4V73_18070 [Morganella psychrotolerans]OBU01881.1 hypothetical protein AYY16_16835 [Morganella psychrotolerans]